MSLFTVLCSGIGHGATCGKPGTVKVPSHRWNAETEEMEEFYVYLCEQHARELRETMEDKFKTGRLS